MDTMQVSSESFSIFPELASVIGVPRQTVHRWKTGARTPRGPARAALVVLSHLREHHPDIYAEVCERLRGK